MSAVAIQSEEWRALTLEERRALRSVRELRDYVVSKPKEARKLINHLAGVPVECAYTAAAAFYFAIGYVHGCLATSTEESITAAKVMLDSQLDYDKSGMKPSDFFGIHRKYGKT